MDKIGVFFRTGYNYDRDLASDASGLHCPPEEGVTQQSFAEECDINTIVRRFGLTGELPENYRMPVSGDFSGVSDFQSAMNSVRAAEEAFMQVPAAIRARFSNDPQRFISFFDDPDNRAEALKLGLIKPPLEVTRDVVQAVDELAAKLQPKT